MSVEAGRLLFMLRVLLCFKGIEHVRRGGVGKSPEAHFKRAGFFAAASQGIQRMALGIEEIDLLGYVVGHE